ncbi:MAG: hypothetical protein HY719_11715 [Planctomycetes bacterium]|nr:hypothetical protein [Planctomycetota bacterium]
MRIILSALWIALMLVFLLGDVIRIFAGDFTAGELAGRQAAPWMWLLIAAIMLTPIGMIVLSLVPPSPATLHSRLGRSGPNRRAALCTRPRCGR